MAKDLSAKYTEAYMAKTEEEVNQLRVDKTKLPDAKEARYIADVASAPLRHIAKLIRDSADEGYTSLPYCIGRDFSSDLLDFLVYTLMEAGYHVEVDRAAETLLIKW